MSKIYLVNIGANTTHASIARSPVFDDQRFTFVSLPVPGKRGMKPYSREVRPFVRRIRAHETHSDPDWKNLTYGDFCKNPRARALRRVVEDDVLLFWALLWRNTGRTWATFTGERNWCLIGAIRVREILEGGQKPTDASKPARVKRAGQNVHFWSGRLAPDHRVFIGCTRRSALFAKAVDLEPTSRSGLLSKCICAANGRSFKTDNAPQWNSSLRTCRAVWDLDDPKSCARAKIAASAIRKATGYDLLADL